MKILHLSTFDNFGGAARSAYRVHQALLQAEVDSRMLVQVKTGDDTTVCGPASKAARGIGYIRPYMDQLPLHFYPKRTETVFHPAWLPFSGVLQRINRCDPDVVHLHWIAGGFLRIEDLIRIRRPVVWTMHDMWTFTGGCHYDEECGKYRHCCQVCPQLGASKRWDMSARVFNRKLRIFGGLKDLTAVGTSRWLSDAARGSSLLKDKRILNIPTPIDPTAFRPMEKLPARDMLGLPPDKKIVLVGAMDVLKNARKGFSELCRALGRIKAPEVELAVFGAVQPRAGAVFDLPAHFLGTLHDDLSLRVAYSAADVMVVPSLQENLSNIILESMACGTPVVAFRIGGNPDMIDHEHNGYLAEPFEPADLARGIDRLLNPAAGNAISLNARRKVLDNFTPRRVAGQYLELYETLIRQ